MFAHSCFFKFKHRAYQTVLISCRGWFIANSSRYFFNIFILIECWEAVCSGASHHHSDLCDIDVQSILSTPFLLIHHRSTKKPVGVARGRRAWSLPRDKCFPDEPLKTRDKANATHLQETETLVSPRDAVAGVQEGLCLLLAVCSLWLIVWSHLHLCSSRELVSVSVQ